MLSYCISCKERVEIPEDAESGYVIDASGMLRKNNTCPQCGKKISHVLRSATDEDKEQYTQLPPPKHSRSKNKSKGKSKGKRSNKKTAPVSVPPESSSPGKGTDEEITLLKNKTMSDAARIRELEEEVWTLKNTEGMNGDAALIDKENRRLRSRIEELQDTISLAREKEVDMLQRESEMREQSNHLKIRLYEVEESVRTHQDQGNGRIKKLSMDLDKTRKQLRAVEDTLLHWEKKVCISCPHYESEINDRSIKFCQVDMSKYACPAKVFYNTLRFFLKGHQEYTGKGSPTG